MMARRTQKQNLQRRIEAEMYDVSNEIDYSADEVDKSWINYQEYLEAQRRNEYEKTLVEAYERSGLDPLELDDFDWWW